MPEVLSPTVNCHQNNKYTVQYGSTVEVTHWLPLHPTLINKLVHVSPIQVLKTL